MFRRRYRASCRAADREVPVGPADPGPCSALEPVDWLIRSERSRAVAAAVGRLPREAQEVLALRVECRLAFREIGARTGRTEEAARKLFTRALARLRQTVPPHAG